MKRDPALASLSRDHHQALFVAQRLRRATADTAEEARAAFLTYWEQHGRAHFRIEEEVLLPGFAEHGDAHHPLVARALCDHLEIRKRANRLVHEDRGTPDALDRLGLCLGEHVRLEERDLFPLIENTLPADRLAALAVAIERAEQAEAPPDDG